MIIISISSAKMQPLIEENRKLRVSSLMTDTMIHVSSTDLLIHAVMVLELDVEPAVVPTAQSYLSRSE